MIESQVLRKILDDTVRQALEQTAGCMHWCATQAHLIISDPTARTRSEDRPFRRHVRTEDGRTVTVSGM